MSTPHRHFFPCSRRSYSAADTPRGYQLRLQGPGTRTRRFEIISYLGVKPATRQHSSTGTCHRNEELMYSIPVQETVRTTREIEPYKGQQAACDIRAFFLARVQLSGILRRNRNVSAYRQGLTVCSSDRRRGRGVSPPRDSVVTSVCLPWLKSDRASTHSSESTFVRGRNFRHTALQSSSEGCHSPIDARMVMTTTNVTELYVQSEAWGVCVLVLRRVV